MTLGLIFWILMLLWLVFGLWSNWPGVAPGQPYTGWFPIGSTLLLFILFLLLGWHAFGPPIHS
jgi:hypothetical protein